MIRNATTLVSNALKKFEENSNKNGIKGVPTGFKDLDSITSGLQEGNLIIIASRPGMGGSLLATSIVKNAAINNGQAVAFFSLENSSHYYITKMIASETGMSLDMLRDGRLEPHEWELLNLKLDGLSKSQIYMEDALLSFSDLKIKATELVENKNVKLIVFDSLQSIWMSDSPTKSHEEKIVETTKYLKILAKELQVPIIALSQIAEEAEEKEGSSMRPLLSDLEESESEAMVQMADVILFVYRPEYYGVSEWEDGSSSEGQAELILAKHKNGGLDNMRVRFRGYLAEFSDLP